MTPDNLLYSKEHEWVKVNDANLIVTIGITEYAADNLGDIVFIELPDSGTNVDQFGKLGEVESVKAVSDIYSPISGTIIETNPDLIDHPEHINNTPYEQGWIAKIQISDNSELDNLMKSEEYTTMLSEE
jgi:glycine cleavage system H protein